MQSNSAKKVEEQQSPGSNLPREPPVSAVASATVGAARAAAAAAAGVLNAKKSLSHLGIMYRQNLSRPKGVVAPVGEYEYLDGNIRRWKNNFTALNLANCLPEELEIG